MLNEYPYIVHPPTTGALEYDVIQLLYKNNRKKTATHCAKVAKTCSTLATQFNLDERLAYISGILHDVSAVVKPSDMLVYAEKNGWYIDESERKYNFILHQRISATIAKEHYSVFDNDILSAIECHSTLKVSPSKYDMILFLADKISWDQEGEPPYINILQRALNDSLNHAALAYIQFALDNNHILLPHRWLIEAKKWLEFNEGMS